MKTEFLKGLGLEQEAIAKIMAENGKDVAAEQEKARKTAAERDNYKSQLETATENLEKFKQVNPDELHSTIEMLKNDLKAKEEEYAAKEADRTFMEGLKESIRGAGGRNEKAVMALLDLEVLKSSKNQTEDIKKALDAAKQSDAYLFGTDEPINNPVAGSGGVKAGGLNAVARAMGLTERDLEE